MNTLYNAPHTEEERDSDELYEHHRIVVDKGQDMLRIDKFLKDRLRNATRNKIQLAIDEGFVLVNSKETRNNYKIKPGDVITVNMPEPPRDTDIIPEEIPLNIVYEDDSILIVNKAPGMVVHPAFNNWTGTLVNALTFYFQNLPTTQNGAGRPGLVHRIDKDTSGLLVIAKTEQAMMKIARQFYDHSIDRTYWALVWGDVEQDSGTIRGNLGRSMQDRRLVTVYEDASQGKHAVTHYKVLQRFRYVTLVECKLETGRTHQIRAHMRHIGHSLFNDAMYGGDSYLKGPGFSKYKSFVDNCFKEMPRQALHARTLGFNHPETGERVFFQSELPDDFKNVLEKWERYVASFD